MRNKFYPLVAGAFLFSGVVAHAQKTYVLDRNNNSRECEEVSADSAGTLTITVGGAKLTLRRGQYRYAVTPKPSDVMQLERLAAEGKNDVVIANADKVFEKYQFLGWGGYIAAIHANSKLAGNDAAGALQVLQKATAPEIVASHEGEVTKARVAALIAANRENEAVPLLGKLKSSDSDEVAAFAFLVDGRILEKQGSKQEAVIAYLKTALLFGDGVAEAEKAQARQRIAEILSSIGDPRAQQFR